MATTLKVRNGDVVVNDSTGRPKVIGNTTNERDTVKAREKAVQDLQRSLSINRVANGTGAAISELIGVIDGAGLSSITMLLNSRIRNMFAAIIKVQNQSRTNKPDGERFRTITFMQVIPDSTRTGYTFRLDTKTFANQTIVQSGSIVV
jgi:hypothetical protein